MLKKVEITKRRAALQGNAGLLRRTAPQEASRIRRTSTIGSLLIHLLIFFLTATSSDLFKSCPAVCQPQRENVCCTHRCWITLNGAKPGNVVNRKTTRQRHYRRPGRLERHHHGITHEHQHSQQVIGNRRNRFSRFSPRFTSGNHARNTHRNTATSDHDDCTVSSPDCGTGLCSVILSSSVAGVIELHLDDEPANRIPLPPAR
jgi:hypothetical protein